MPRTPLLRIGAFARAASLSVKALRLYHQIGLLVPAVVDPQTGYRAYAPTQLMDAGVIRRLRAIGISLQDIEVVLEARDPEVTRKVLADHASMLQTKLEDVSALLDEVDGSPSGWPGGEISVRHEQAVIVLVMDGTPEVTALEAFGRHSARTLREAAAAAGAVVTGPFGACFPPALDDDYQQVTAFLPIRKPVLLPADGRAAGVRVAELPETDVAVLQHVGPYSELEACYMRLGSWVAHHAVPSDQPVREHYLGPVDDGPHTELLWPIVTTEVSA